MQSETDRILSLVFGYDSGGRHPKKSQQGAGRGNPPAATVSHVSHAKLTNIYSAIDSGGYKQALKLIGQSQKRYPTSLILKALRALVLQRNNQPVDALLWAKEVQDMVPTDPAVLDSLRMTYNALGEPGETTKCYENAHAKGVVGEEFMKKLFFCYVRERRYRDQISLAMKLSREYGKPRYFMWGVMSNLMLYWSGDGKSMNLSIARKLLEKKAEVGEFENEDALLLYLSVLREQSDWQVLLQMLNSEISKKLFKFERERQSMIADALSQQGKYEEAVKEWINLIEVVDADDWSFYEGFFESASSAGLSEDAMKETLSRFQTSNPRLRAPFLAELRYLSDTGSETLKGALLNYYKLFGTKPSFCLDVEPHILKLSGNDRQQLMKDVIGMLGAKTDGIPYLLRLANYRQLCQSLFDECYCKGGKMNKEKLLMAIKEDLQLISDSLGAGEWDASSGIGSLFMDAVLLLSRLFEESEHAVLAALALLSVGREHAKGKDFKLVFVGVHLLNRLAAIKASHKLFKELDVRQIQQLSVSPAIVHHSVACCSFDIAGEVLADVTDFVARNNMDRMEFDLQVYDRSKYSKVREFADLADKIASSQVVLSARAEETALGITEKVAFSPSHHMLLDFLTTQEDVNQPPYLLKDVKDTVDRSILFPWESKTNLFCPSTTAKTVSATALDMSVNREGQLSLLRIRHSINIALFKILNCGSDEESKLEDMESMKELSKVDDAVSAYETGDNVRNTNLIYYSAIRKILRFFASVVARMEVQEEKLNEIGGEIDALEAEMEGLFSDSLEFALVPGELQTQLSFVSLFLNFAATFAVLLDFAGDKLHLSAKRKDMIKISSEERQGIRGLRKRVEGLLSTLLTKIDPIKEKISECAQREHEFADLDSLKIFPGEGPLSDEYANAMTHTLSDVYSAQIEQVKTVIKVATGLFEGIQGEKT